MKKYKDELGQIEDLVSESSIGEAIMEKIAAIWFAFTDKHNQDDPVVVNYDGEEFTADEVIDRLNYLDVELGSKDREIADLEESRDDFERERDDLQEKLDSFDKDTLRGFSDKLEELKSMASDIESQAQSLYSDLEDLTTELDDFIDG